jgi:hypothetical protein
MTYLVSKKGAGLVRFRIWAQFRVNVSFRVRVRVAD